MNLKDFIEEVRENTGLESTAEAERMVEVVFRLLSARLSAAEEKDLASQLPQDLKAFWEKTREKEVDIIKFRKDEFLEDIKKGCGLKNKKEAEKAGLAVFRALKTRISEGEARDVEAQLPAGIKSMWRQS